MGFKHYKFQPNEYVFVMKNGKVIKQGIGLSFFVTHLTQECQWFLQSHLTHSLLSMMC